MNVKVGDRIIFNDCVMWDHSEEVVCCIERGTTQRGHIIWFKDNRGQETQLSEMSFLNHLRLGQLEIINPLTPKKYIKKHTWK